VTYEYLTNSDALGVTATHPLYSLDRQQFIPTEDIKVGEHLLSKSGIITVVSKTYDPTPQEVYNLEVGQWHNFLVGVSGVVVHNSYVWPWKNTSASIAELTAGGGKCKPWAKQIQDAIGGDIIHITDKYGAPGIGNVFTKEGKLITKTDPWVEHYAVRIDDMIYDRITGPSGLPIKDYKKLFEYGEYLDFNTIVHY
jgi:hypothetical protein